MRVRFVVLGIGSFHVWEIKHYYFRARADLGHVRLARLCTIHFKRIVLVYRQLRTSRHTFSGPFDNCASVLHSIAIIKTSGQFILDRRRELGLSGRELLAIKKSDGKPISIPGMTVGTLLLIDWPRTRR